MLLSIVSGYQVLKNFINCFLIPCYWLSTVRERASDGVRNLTDIRNLDQNIDGYLYIKRIPRLHNVDIIILYINCCT